MRGQYPPYLKTSLPRLTDLLRTSEIIWILRRCPIPGYGNRVIHLDFTRDLSDDPDKDKIWVSLYNPRLMPPSELRPANDVPVDPATGRPVDMVEAERQMFGLFAKLIIGWRVYDASHIVIDPETGEVQDQPLLPHPATAELVAKLPAVILTRLTEEFTQAVNPQ
jgi:hypothetical protein